MASEVSVPRFVFIKPFAETDEYALGNSFPLLVAVVIAYLLFVLKVGPDFMKNREPYKLKNTILVYNAVQVVLSAYFTYITAEILISQGMFPSKCCEDDPVLRKPMIYAIYVYFLGKLTELLDTVFFVLRKKYNQISFLHVYHHASVVLGTWMMFKYSVTQSAAYAGFINSLVHVVMYFYYFMAALGPQYQKYLTWKKHITTFQLVQFVSMFMHQLVMLFVNTSCSYSVVGLIYFFYSTVLFYVLFKNFYNQTYKKSEGGKKQANAQDIAINEKINSANDEEPQNANIANGHKIKAQ